jgi:hypothetical protein
LNKQEHAAPSNFAIGLRRNYDWTDALVTHFYK